MKALSVRQPWAWAIIFAGKDIENRFWNTRYRGPLLIHAGAVYDAGAAMPGGVLAPKKDDLAFGAIIGLVDLVHVVKESPSMWFEGPYGFVLRNPRALGRPVACPGERGLWTPAPELSRLVEAAWKG